VDLAHRLGGHLPPAGAKELRALILAQGERLLAQLHHPGGAGPAELEGQHDPAREGQVGVRRQVAQQQAEGLGGGMAHQRVHVVEGQDELVGQRLRHLVAQLVRLLLEGALQGEMGPDPWEALPQPLREVGQERIGRADPLVAGQPHPGHADRSEGLGEQGALAVARAGDDQDEAAAQSGVQPLAQAGTIERPRRRTRRKEPRAQHAAVARRARRRLRGAGGVGRPGHLEGAHPLPEPFEGEPTNG
jgi:hypothetical protein